jgi:hypothetical protein
VPIGLLRGDRPIDRDDSCPATCRRYLLERTARQRRAQIGAVDDVRGDDLPCSFEQGSGTGVFFPGSGNDVTVFAEITGTSDAGIDFEDAVAFPGTMSGGDISNFTRGLILSDRV